MAINTNPGAAGVPGAAASSYSPQAANGTFTLKTGPGIFYGIVTTVVGTTSTATAFDNTAASGNQLASALPTTALGLVAAGIPAGGVAFQNGLTVVLAGAVAASVLVLFS